MILSARKPERIMYFSLSELFNKNGCDISKQIKRVTTVTRSYYSQLYLKLTWTLQLLQVL